MTTADAEPTKGARKASLIALQSIEAGIYREKVDGGDMYSREGSYQIKWLAIHNFRPTGAYIL
jgi:hypothetical protein